MKGCLECGKELLGRCDKKYCSDGCRNSYNNRVHREETEESRLINRILNNNRKILKGLIIAGRKSYTLVELSEKGFNFRYSTSFEVKKNQKVVIHCYNYSYIISSKGIVYVAQKNI